MALLCASVPLCFGVIDQLSVSEQFSDLMYPPTTKDDSARSHVPSLAAEHDGLWKMKYEKWGFVHFTAVIGQSGLALCCNFMVCACRLEEQYKVMKDRNEELEDRLLNLVEKVEQEKIILSNEIDQLVG